MLLERSFEGHAGPVNVCIFDDDGQYCLSAGSDKQIILWNTLKGTPVQSYVGHGWEVLDVALSPGRRHLASAGTDRPVFLWDPASAKIIRKYHGHLQRINTVAFSEDASVLASGSYDRSVRLWDVRSSARFPLQILEDARDSVESVAMRGARICTGSVDGVLRTYDVRKFALLEDGLCAPVTSVQRGTGCVLVSCLDANLRLLDDDSGRVLGTYAGIECKRYGLRPCFSPDESRIAGGSEEGSVVIWDLLTGRLLVKAALHKGPVKCVQWHPHRDALLSCSLDGTLRLHTIAEAKQQGAQHRLGKTASV